MAPEISILILTHNAPDYVAETIETLNDVTRKSTRNRMEIIVWDNDSNIETQQLVKQYKSKGYIDKLHLCNSNLLFAGGNNRASKLASESSKYYLLLNSDVCIKDPDWLDILINACSKGYSAVSYGVCDNPVRADGYCLLIDRKLYDKFQLDENYQWFFSVTKIQAQIMGEKRGKILAFRNHDKLLKHYGGKSGNDFKGAKGMDTEFNEITKWYEDLAGSITVKKAFTFMGLVSHINKYRFK